LVEGTRTMSVTLHWSKLRPHNGSVNDAFEELCCLLAKHPEDEPSRLSAGWAFTRKGRPDAGLECFWVRPDGTKLGWQAK
jgi:hypothetical protein